MRTKTIELFKFDELSDAAKEKARDWYRPLACDDYDWFEFVHEDAVACGGILGIMFDHVGKTVKTPQIYFSGFGSQGDGACFEGSYAYAKGATKKIRQHAPTDDVLHSIADDLQALQRRHWYRLEAKCDHHGHYHHSHSMRVETTDSNTGNEVDNNTSTEMQDLMRRFADWIFDSLRNEYNYQTSDEQIDEMLRANEYEFTSEGRKS
jgi:hypothetical protein